MRPNREGVKVSFRFLPVDSIACHGVRERPTERRLRWTTDLQ